MYRTQSGGSCPGMGRSFPQRRPETICSIIAQPGPGQPENAAGYPRQVTFEITSF